MADADALDARRVLPRVGHQRRATCKHAQPDAIVMHPGPMNRGVEITSEVADGPQSVIRQQVTQRRRGAHGGAGDHRAQRAGAQRRSGPEGRMSDGSARTAARSSSRTPSCCRSRSSRGRQFVIRLRAPQCAAAATPGSFAHLTCDPLLPMRRPLSIMRADAARGLDRDPLQDRGPGPRGAVASSRSARRSA